LQNPYGAIRPIFGCEEGRAVKEGNWELEGFHFRLTAVDPDLQTYRVLVTQPSRDGFVSSTRDVTLRLTDRQQLIAIFTITSGMRENSEVCADLVEAFVSTEFFVRSPAATLVNLSNN